MLARAAAEFPIILWLAIKGAEARRETSVRRSEPPVDLSAARRSATRSGERVG
jgi:hypothetical protein